MTNLTDEQQQIDNDEISLKELIQKIQEWFAYLKTQWKFIIGIASIGAIIGFTIIIIASHIIPNVPKTILKIFALCISSIRVMLPTTLLS